MSDILKLKGAEVFIQCIVRGMSQKDAAAAAGVTENTAYRRMRDPEWLAVIEAKRDERESMYRDKIGEAVDEAVDRIQQLMHEDGGTSTQLGAARTLLEYAVKLRPQGEVRTVNANVAGSAELKLDDEALDIIRGLGIVEKG